MIKKNAQRRIISATLALVIASLIYFFPNDSDNEISTTTNYLDVNTSFIYLINNDDYVIKTTIVTKETEDIAWVKEMIDALTIDSAKQEYIPSLFKAIIPKNTKVLDISLDKGLLKINFSKELLNVLQSSEEQLIEALVYTLTENKNIKEIMLFIEGQKLEYLPQSKIKLPNTLTRDFGINKVYDLTSLKNITKTTIYYIGNKESLTYYIPITKIDNNQNEKIEIIIEELKSSPIYETNLQSYLSTNTEILNYEILENQINLTFNNAIFDDFNKSQILEEVKYSIAYSIEDTLHISEINFIVDGKVVSTFKEN